MTKILWLISNWQIVLLSALAMSIFVLGVYMKGRMDEKAYITSKGNAKELRRIEDRQELELTIKRKPKIKIQKELEKEWCRDCQ